MKIQEQFNLQAANIGRGTIGLIDALVQRGAFRGEELSTISQLRDACVNLVQTAEQFEMTNDPDPAAMEKAKDKDK